MNVIGHSILLSEPHMFGSIDNLSEHILDAYMLAVPTSATSKVSE